MSHAGNGDKLTKDDSHHPGPRRRSAGNRRVARSARLRLPDARDRSGPQFLLERLKEQAFRRGVPFASSATTPYVNTIPADQQPPYPGDRELERKIKSIIRWNAMAMVVRANKESPGIGGHISTYASAATLYEVAFNHFLHGKQGASRPTRSTSRATPRRASTRGRILLGRLTEEQLKNFRRELAPGGGLSSYPHPWLMPDFWEFPTVSMGLGPIMAIYQARFNHYLVDRGIQARRPGLAGVGLPGRRRMRRARGPGGHHPGRPRAARQPDLRRQLQPPAARRPGPRQRQDHPGTRRGLPRRRLERDQGDLGLQLGPAAGARHRRPAGPPHGRGGRRRVSEIHRHARRLHPRAFLRRRSAAGGDGRRLERRAAQQAAARRPRSGSRSTRPTRRRSSTAARPRSSWPRRSRATGWARPAKAATSPTSRRSSTRTSWSSSAAASRFPFPTSRRPTPTFYKPPDDSPEMRYLRRAPQGAGRFRARPRVRRRSS